MPALNELYVLTEQMIEHLEQSKKSREEIVNLFDDYVSKRDKLLKEIQPPYSDGEKKVGKTLVELDQQLQLKVNQFFKSFKSDLAYLKKKRQSNKKYINPYANVYGTDGSFIDKKN
ncbi:hypothetical protein [Tenuibacillus multivorans]|uniref:Flagellar protein FliT n=1 Tax=Tenuibacillus multivorans TaxID=237069 RepID=A0A1H0G8P5_9BACI|nr:hypothetical protein [Tenuibacillus multivorans]GEL78700.1 hypothetical protein TMU01_29350 [Tenuibacillus multivorans]SDO03220.1 flagellar protein FliT [Tenuibacillus multivorans]